jgi:hypothetical protein
LQRAGTNVAEADDADCYVQEGTLRGFFTTVISGLS